MAKRWKKMSSEEIRLAKMWYKEDKKSPYEIGKLLRRKTQTSVLVLRWLYCGDSQVLWCFTG